MKNFLVAFFKDAARIELFPLATQLTYRLIFSIFPFLIFLISLVGYFNIDATQLLQEVYALFPAKIAGGINDIIHEVVDIRNPAVLSLSLLLSLFTVINGFRAIMRGVNRCYEEEDNRHFIKRWLLCALLVLILICAIILSITSIIFEMGFLAPLALMLCVIMLIYHLASAVHHPFLSLLPGAALTLTAWGASTWAFNIYISNFANFSVIYGSIASVFLLMLWLNIISTTILLGALLNAKLGFGVKNDSNVK